MTECSRHQGQCAYAPSSLRCDWCHARWFSIEQRTNYEGTREAHLRRHEEESVRSFLDAQKYKDQSASRNTPTAAQADAEVQGVTAQAEISWKVRQAVQARLSRVQDH
jgi:hypothetical protein